MKGQSLAIVKGLLSSAIVFGSLCASLAAEDVFISSYNGATDSTDVIACPLSCPSGSVSLTGSSAYSTATPAPPADVRRSRYGTGTNAVWSVTPTDIDLTLAGSLPHHYSALEAQSIYRILITLPSVGFVSPDLVVNMTCTGGSLGPSAMVPVTAFRSSSPRDTWITVGYITNDIASPTITFTYASGAISSTARWFMDAVRFESLSCGCCPGPLRVNIAGTLFAGQTSVLVTNVSAGATNITVYADGNPIGATNYAPGFVGGQVRVSTATLTAGSVVNAKQVKAGCFSFEPWPSSTVQSSVTLNLNPEKQAGVTINGVVGSTYQIQSLNDLTGTNWVSMTNVTLQQSSEVWVDATGAATNASHFYRVRLAP